MASDPRYAMLLGMGLGTMFSRSAPAGSLTGTTAVARPAATAHPNPGGTETGTTAVPRPEVAPGPHSGGSNAGNLTGSVAVPRPDPLGPHSGDSTPENRTGTTAMPRGGVPADGMMPLIAGLLLASGGPGSRRAGGIRGQGDDDTRGGLGRIGQPKRGATTSLLGY